jgi:hypothetical protein
MIKFFRKIRYELMGKNKTGKYIKYAIGEIVLVVIGILIALSLNNWNENRISKNKEKLLLKELHNEFKFNKTQLDSVIYYHKRAFKCAENIMSKFPIDAKTINLDSLGYNTLYMGWVYTFNPSEGVTNALSSSSSFDLISNETLRKSLISWSDIVADYQEEELRAYYNYNNHLKPFEKKHMKYGNDYKQWYNDPRLDLSFLETVEYENFVTDRYVDLDDIINNSAGELDLVIKTIDQIIELSNPNWDD